ncbi:hypothetical protein IGI53_001063 [Enterococcus sp. DIV0788_1]
MIETYRENDEDYYKWLYLGEVIGLGTHIYNISHFHCLDKMPDDDYIVNLYFSVDSGHQVSATTCSCFALTRKKNVILLDTYYYSPAGKANKKAPTELSKDLHDFIEKCQGYYDKFAYQVTIDSVQNLLAQGSFFYLAKESNKIFIEEQKKYQWDEDTLNSDDPK